MSVSFWLFSASLQAIAILLVALIIERRAHRRSSAQRHAILISAVLLVVACPIAVACLPPLKLIPASFLENLIHGDSDAESGILAEVEFNQSARAGGRHVAVSDLLETEPQGSNTDEATRFDKALSNSSSAEALSFPSASSSREIGTSDPAVRRSNFNMVTQLIIEWCIAIWFVGCVALLVRIGLSWLCLGLIVSKSQKPAMNQLDFESLRDRMGASKRVRLLASDSVSVPFACGVIFPRVVVPTSLMADGTSEEKCVPILMHELAHVARRDPAWQWVVLIAQTINWFNPLMWIVSKRLVRLRELACDDHVIAKGIEPADYSRILVDMCTQRRSPSNSSLAVAFYSTNELELRIRSLFQGSKDREPVSAKRIVHGCVAVGLLVISVSLLRGTEPQSGEVKQADEKSENAPLAEGAENAKIQDEFQIPEEREIYAAPISLIGLARDQKLAPMPNAKVFLAAGSPGYKLLAETVTDHRGIYEFKDVALPIEPSDLGPAHDSGEFEVFGQAEGFALAWRACKNFYPNSSKPELVGNDESAHPIQNNLNDTIETDLYFAEPFLLGGRLTDENGAPIVGAELNIRDAELWQLDESQPKHGYDGFLRSWNASDRIPLAVKIQKTDENGSFEFSQLPPGFQWTIWFQADGFAQRRFHVVTSNANRPQQIDGQPAYFGRLDEKLESTVPIQVQILTGDSGEPAENVSVNALSTEGKGSHWQPTEGDGTCTLDLVPGAYQLAIIPAYRTPYWRTQGEEFEVRRGDNSVHVFNIAAAAQVQVTALSRQTGSPIEGMDLVAKILDRVPDPWGEQVEGVHQYRSYERDTRISHGNRIRTNQDGKLRHFFKPGRYQLYLRPASDLVGDELYRKEAQTLELVAGVPANLTFLIDTPEVKESPQETLDSKLVEQLSRRTETASKQDGKKSPDPEVSGIIQKLKERDGLLQSLVVDFDSIQRHNFYPPGVEPQQPEMIEDSAVAGRVRSKVHFEARRDGCERVENDSDKVLIRFDNSEVRKLSRAITTYNPKRYLARRLESAKSPEGEVLKTLGYESAKNVNFFPSPFDFLSNSLIDESVESLENENATIVGRNVWEGRPVVVLQTDPKVVRNHTYRQHFWIDIERAIVVRRQSFGRIGDGPWGLHIQRDYKGHYQVDGTDVFFPETSTHWNYVVTESGQGHLASREIYLFHSWQLNPEIEDERFELEFPEGVQTNFR